jgi:dolichol-phosphate mannosyltransferase
MRFTLIIPTLNEAASIASLFEGIEAAFRQFPTDVFFDIVVVDDGSTDDTVLILRSLNLPFPLKIIERVERGLATAVLTGFRASESEVLGVIDADLSHPPELLPKMVETIRGHDLVIGSRHAPGGAVEEWPWYRRYASMFMTALVRPLGLGVRDPLSGYFLLKRKLIDGQKLTPCGYKILLEILVKSGCRDFLEIPYTFRNRGLGKSKMGARVTFEYLEHLLGLYFGRLRAVAAYGLTKIKELLQ